MNSTEAEIKVTLHNKVVQTLNAEVERFILTIESTIYGRFSDNSTKWKIGELKLFRILLSNALDEGASWLDVFDQHQQTMDMGEAVYDGSFSDFSPWIKSRYEDASPYDDLLILDRLTLAPQVRGQRLGLGILHRAIRDWSGGCSLVAMKPFPLQYEGKSVERENKDDLKLADFRESKKESFRRLRAYYAQLGFERIDRSDFYALCVHEKRPSTNDLKIPISFTAPLSLMKDPSTVAQ